MECLDPVWQNGICLNRPTEYHPRKIVIALFFRSIERESLTFYSLRDGHQFPPQLRLDVELHQCYHIIDDSPGVADRQVISLEKIGVRAAVEFCPVRTERNAKRGQDATIMAFDAAIIWWNAGMSSSVFLHG